MTLVIVTSHVDYYNALNKRQHSKTTWKLQLVQKAVVKEVIDVLILSGM